MRPSRWLVATLFVASTVVVVSAQQRQPGGGKGGFGITNQVLTNTALQEELKITDAQKEKLKAAADKQAAAQKERFQAFKDAAGDKEKLQALFAAGQKETEANQKLIEETLTAEQKARIKQIERQLAGVRAFTQDEVVADLKLDDTQKTKVKGIVDEYVKDSQGLGGFGGFGGKGGFDKEKAAEAQKKREKLTKGALADIDEVLNDAQRKTWKDLTGPEFDRSKLQFGGGGGFGGFPGGGTKGKQFQKKD